MRKSAGSIGVTSGGKKSIYRKRLTIDLYVRDARLLVSGFESLAVASHPLQLASKLNLRSCFPHFLIQTDPGVRAKLALQDAVATANLLSAKLRRGAVSLVDLEQVQKRREFPMRFVQSLQIMVHRRINGRTSGSGDSLPFIARCSHGFQSCAPFRHY